MNNRLKIIFIATIFNLLFEYSLRGINNLVMQPFLPLILFSIYFTLFSMVEDLIVRFKLKDYHLMVLAFFYGTVYGALTSGIVFIRPSFLGVAWVPMVLVNIAWWGVLQAVVTFYLVNLISTRDWHHPRLSYRGWVLCLTINVAAVLVFQTTGLIPTGTPVGRLSIVIVALASLLLFLVLLRRKSKHESFKQNTFLTAISFTTVSLLLFSAIFLIGDPIRSNTSNINALSLKVVSWYTLGLSMVLLGYRLITKKEIPV
ncbi:MAG: hypothetical protein NUV52_01395 [Candidatus Roizmanbacteria bacterium]|nr:hypothetical protein [Candidatus Roizmanbacteria bacterium]